MADVSHTISGLLLHPPMPHDQACDLCEAPATTRMQGETDSFGAEWCDFCDHHAERVRAGACFAYCVECDAVFEPEDQDDPMPRCAAHTAALSTTEAHDA